tara:strand:+ start:57 stop:308 length:252 start_codon:yes stop_codon:yes gene_type:complete
VNKIKLLAKKIVNFYWWLILLFQKRYTIIVSYDSQWGNEDDQEWNHVRKIIKSNFKELKFRTDDKRTIHIKGMNGLRYRIEDE